MKTKKTMPTKILKCLCGGNGQHIKLFIKNRYDCFIKCDKCGWETKAYTSKQNAVKAWNKAMQKEGELQ